MRLFVFKQKTAYEVRISDWSSDGCSADVYVVLASGGVYSAGPAAAFDHAVPYLKATLGFLGMSEVEVIRIEGVAMDAEAERDALAKAHELVSGLAVAIGRASWWERVCTYV